MEETLVQILIQGGLSGATIALVILNYKTHLLFNKTLNNHLHEIADARKDDSKAKVELAKSITLLAERIDNCPYKK